MDNKVKDGIVEKIMFSMDLGVREKLPKLRTGGEVENLELTLSNKRSVHIYDLIQSGPLVLVFIRGTWCPFCRLHLKKLRTWADNLKNKNAKIIVVSTEEPDVISKWLDDNPVNYIFASDPTYEIGNYFGVKLETKNHFQAVTFLIDSNKTVKLAYGGRRGEENFKEVQKVI